MTIILENSDYKNINGVLSLYGLQFTNEQIDVLLEKYPSLITQLAEFGVDTCFRESLIGVISKDLVGRDWPTYGDAKDDPTFTKRFEEAALKAGYKII